MFKTQCLEAYLQRLTSRASDLVSALQINSYNTPPLAAGRREVTDITETGLCVMQNIQCNASASHKAQLRHGCLLSGEQQGKHTHQITTSGGKKKKKLKAQHCENNFKNTNISFLHQRDPDL